MGLDTYLYKQNQKNKIEQVFDKLIDADRELEYILCWRKNYNLIEWFRNNMCEIDNCKFHEVSKATFKKWLKDLKNGLLEYEWVKELDEIGRDIDMITKILKEEDFKITKFFIYNWW